MRKPFKAIKDGITFDVIKFAVTREVKCKFGVHKDDNAMDICRFMSLNKMGVHYDKDGRYINIETIEGIMRARLGDYIIKDDGGEFYPCNPDIFKEMYNY